jgi:hypothetical protein
MQSRTRIALITASRDRPACTRSAHHNAMSEAGTTATAALHTAREDTSLGLALAWDRDWKERIGGSPRPVPHVDDGQLVLISNGSNSQADHVGHVGIGGNALRASR